MSERVGTKEGGRAGRLIALAIAAFFAAALLVIPAAASAAGRVYWFDNTQQIPFAALDGSGGGILPIAGGTLDYPGGVAIDSATSRIFWLKNSGGISFANLDGSGRDDLNTSGAIFNSPLGAAIDPEARRIYWANSFPSSIGYANLDGSGGGTLDTGAAPIFSAEGVAIDLATGRIYWALISTDEIGYANLDGSGGGAFNTAGGTVDGPDGVAIDPVTKRLYWTNDEGAVAVSYANLDGSGGGGNLNVSGGSAVHPRGAAIDPEARRIYWADEESPGAISYADLGGSGGGVLPTDGASVQYPRFPILQTAPHPTAAPTLSGNAAIGATLSCSQGSWAGDAVGSQLYRAATGFSYGWLRDGAAIPGASTTSYVPASAGSYACRVSAANAAGATAQTSAALRVPPVQKRRGKATVARLAKVEDGKVRLRMHCPAAGGECRGTAKLFASGGASGSRESRSLRRGRQLLLGKRQFRLAPGKRKIVSVKLSGHGRELLGSAPGHRLEAKLAGSGVKHRRLVLLRAS